MWWALPARNHSIFFKLRHFRRFSNWLKWSGSAKSLLGSQCLNHQWSWCCTAELLLGQKVQNVHPVCLYYRLMSTKMCNASSNSHSLNWQFPSACCQQGSIQSKTAVSPAFPGGFPSDFPHAKCPFKSGWLRENPKRITCWTNSGVRKGWLRELLQSAAKFHM